jgi:hypothetical protein
MDINAADNNNNNNSNIPYQLRHRHHSYFEDSRSTLISQSIIKQTNKQSNQQNMK